MDRLAINAANLSRSLLTRLKDFKILQPNLLEQAGAEQRVEVAVHVPTGALLPWAARQLGEQLLLGRNAGTWAEQHRIRPQTVYIRLLFLLSSITYYYFR